jgi:hypothetical protein
MLVSHDWHATCISRRKSEISAYENACENFPIGVEGKQTYKLNRPEGILLTGVINTKTAKHQIRNYALGRPKSDRKPNQGAS